MPPATDGPEPVDPVAVAGRRRAAALSGHQGDEATARRAVGDAAPAVRASALGALARMGALTLGDVVVAAGDAQPAVRARAAELAARFGAEGLSVLVMALGDTDARVIEAAAFTLGELGQTAAGAVGALATVAGDHPDPLCREAAVAALGAVGDQRGLPAILAGTADKPAVRRRAVLALAPFDGPEVDAALERALADRDWQVRQAAEDMVGRDR